MLKFENVSISFPVVSGENQSIKNAILSNLGGTLRRSAGILEIQALKNVTFSMAKGERLAVLGHNGAGKSTLLRAASGAFVPTSGFVKKEAKSKSLLDITLGLEGELSGFENIRRKLIILGIKKSDRKLITSQIEEFSELGEFLNLPLRVYSTGMSLRLAFAIATSTPAPLLIMDEIIGAGDEQFRAKVKHKMLDFINNAGSLLLCTHDLGLAQSLCERAIILENGALIFDGRCSEAVKIYKK